MRGMATLMILMSLYLILLFGSPFSGDLKVSPDPFKRVTQLGVYYKNRVPSPSIVQENPSPLKTIFEENNNDASKSKYKTHRTR
jgi:hypothetical protein